AIYSHRFSFANVHFFALVHSSTVIKNIIAISRMISQRFTKSPPFGYLYRLRIEYTLTPHEY
ncbi:hypothetical protein OFN37_28240, partial [Escherichia coli]|nr:hypothetical protein [Escherichia coli]